MKAAGLTAIDTVVSSTAVLIKSKNSTNQQLIDLISSRIAGVISKSLNSKTKYPATDAKNISCTEICSLPIQRSQN